MLKNKKTVLFLITPVLAIFLVGVAVSFYSSLLTEIVVVALSSLLVFFIIIRNTPCPINKIIGVGFFLRLLLSLVQRFIVNLPDSTADAVTFESKAWTNAEALITGGETIILKGPYYYSAFLSYLYYLFGRTPLIGQFVNVALGTALIYISYQISLTLFKSKKAAVVAAAITALFPTLNLYSAILVREAWIVFFFALSLLFFSYFLKKGGTNNIVYATIFVFLSSILHGGMFLIGLGYLTVFSFYNATKKCFFLSLKQVLTGVAIATIYSFVFFSFFVTYIPSFFDFYRSLEKAEIAAETRATGRTSYLKELSPDNYFDVLWQTPVRSTYLLFTPFLWQVEEKIDAFGIIDSLFYLILLALSLKTIIALLKKDKATAISLIIIFILFVGPFAWGTSNYGSAVRHRQKIILLIIITASYFLSTVSLKEKTSQKTVAYFSNTDFSLKKFFFPLLLSMKKKHYRVCVLAPVTNDNDSNILRQNFSFHGTPLNRSFSIDIIYFLRVLLFCLKESPVLCHNFTIKPCIFASLAQQLAGVKKIYCTITGLGYAFEKDNWLQKIVVFLYRISFKRVQHVIFLNPDDRDKFLQLKIVSPPNSSVILGSGIDTNYFSKENVNKKKLEEIKVEIFYDDNIKYITLVGRALYQKGVREFAEAGRILKKEGYPVQFLLVGPLDKKNPSAIKKEIIDRWGKEGSFLYLGNRDCVREILDLTTIAILPSYHREGVPTALLEAGAMSLPIITTDVAGCREVVKNNINGLLIEPQNSQQIVNSIKEIVESNLVSKMGLESRKFVQEKFRQEIVINQTIAIYDL